MPNFLRLGSTLALLLTVWVQETAASDEATINAAVDGFCAEQTYIKALASQLDSWLSNAEKATADLATEAQLLALAAVKYQQAPAGRQYLALATVAQARTAAAAAEPRDKRPQLTEAATVLTRTAANLAGLQAANTRTLTIPTKGTAAPTVLGVLTSGTKHCSATAQATLAAVADCVHEAQNFKKAQQAGTIVLTAREFKIRDPSTFKLDALKIQTELKGTITSANMIADMNDAAGCVENGTPAGKSSSNAIGMKAAYAETPFSTGTTQPDAAAPVAMAHTSDLSKTPILTTGEEISKAIRKGRANKPALPKLVSEETSNTIATDTTMVAYA
uniref:Variant surface glycoprotein n=1 Tax=Trypanosoma brucei TaxID=5691 RepID=A0A1V0FY61_9TRYP|nr:variant surface glycoprotein [Trypanosoma brucei]